LSHGVEPQRRVRRARARVKDEHACAVLTKL
jgi:hypothetical protein